MDNLSLTELKALCAKKGMPVSGSRHFLIKRLERNNAPPPPSKYDNMNVSELKKHCVEKGIQSNGVKADLVWALIEHVPTPNVIPQSTKIKRTLQQVITHLKSPKSIPKCKIVTCFEVKNAVRTSDDKASKSWLKVWTEYTGLDVTICLIYDCTFTAVVGAHLKHKYNQRRHYIAPTCAFHNSPQFNDKYTMLKNGCSVVSIPKKKHRDPNTKLF